MHNSAVMPRGERHEHGSTIVEGIVAMGVFFLLLALVVQLGFLVIARSAVGSSLDAAARRASVADADPVEEQQRIVAEISKVAPGVTVLEAEVAHTSTGVSVAATVVWAPPGPDLLPIEFTITRHRSLVVPP